MGSAPSEPAPKVKKSRSPPKNIPKRQPPKPVQPIQPYQQQTVQIAQKIVKLPWRLNSDKEARISKIKQKIRSQFRQRFMSNVSKKQTRLIFKPEISDTNLQSSQLFSSRILSKFEAECELDLKIYEQVLSIRLQCLFSKRLQKEKDADWNIEGAFERVEQELEVQFREAMIVLLGETGGKSTIWTVMNLPFQSKKRKIINFLHQEGIDQSKWAFIGDEQLYRIYY